MQRNLINGLLVMMIGGAWLASAPSGAETYKWTDADGKIHYSDQPPPASVKEPVTINPRKTTAPKTSGGDTDTKAVKQKTYVEQEAEFRKRQVEAAEREAAEKKKTDEADEKKKNCEQARTQLRELQSGGRLTRINANGEREFMTDAETAQETERAKKNIASWCK